MTKGSIFAVAGFLMFITGSAASADSSPCGLSLYRDPYSAFSIGKPAGWHVTFPGAGVMVAKDPEQTIGAMVYPVRLRSDYPASRLFYLFANGIDGVIKKAGGTMTLSKPYRRQSGNAEVFGALARVVGEGTVYQVPIWIEKTAGFATLKFYFAPQNQFQTEKPLLEQVVGCFHRQTYLAASPAPGAARRGYSPAQSFSGALLPYQSAYYRAMIPEGWRVTGETESGIDLASPDHTAAVSFAYLSGAGGTPDNFILGMLPRVFSGVSVLRRSPVPSPASGWNAASVEFEATSAEGRRVHGVAFASTMNGYTQSYAMMYIKVATPDRWNALSPLLSKIADSIQITQGNVGSVINEQNRRFNNLESHIEANESAENASIMGSWAYRSKVNAAEAQKYDDALRGWEEVRSPSTGQTYDAPMDSWWSDGPDGPGYYRRLPGAGGGFEKLRQLTR